MKNLSIKLLLVFLSCSFVAKPAIVITFNKPTTSSYYSKTVPVDITITSTYSLDTVKAQVGANIIMLTKTVGTTAQYTGTVDISTQSEGPLSLNVTARDVLGNAQTASQAFNHDFDPVINVTYLYQVNPTQPGKVRIKASVTDVGVSNVKCSVMWAADSVRYSINRQSFTFINSIDTIVDIPLVGVSSVARWFNFAVNPAQGNSVIYETKMYFDWSNYLQPYFSSHNNVVLDHKGDRALILGHSPADGTAQVSIVNITNNSVEQIPLGSKSTSSSRITGVLCDAGAALTINYSFTTLFAQQTAPIEYDSVYVWSNSVLTNVSRPLKAHSTYNNLPFQLKSYGNNVLWENCKAFVNVVTDITSLVSTTLNVTTSVDGYLSNTGVIASSESISGDNLIRQYTINTGITTVLHNKGTFPVIEGSNVLYYLSGNVYLYNGTTDQLLGKSTTTDYQISGGYIAFSKVDANNVQQVWLMAPDKTLKQLSFFSTSSIVERLGSNGRVIFRNGSTRYYADSQTQFKPVQSSYGSVYFLISDFYLNLTGNIFKFNIPPAGPLPIISSITPATAASNTTIAIKGKNFLHTTAVTFGNTPAYAYTIVSDSLINAVVYTGASGSVSVTTGDGVVALSGFTYLNIPVITSVSSLTGTAGTFVNIYGYNLSSVNSVKFGGIAAAGFSYNPVDNYLTVKVGSGANGDITITSATGTGTYPGFVFTAPPVITNISPSSASAGAIVTLTGTNLSGVTSVLFGGTAAASFVVNSPTLITAVVGNGATGAVQISTSNTSLVYGSFTFLTIPAPVITSISSSTAATGQTITITGTNFTGATAVSFGGVSASSFTVNSSTSITAIVGSGASGNVVVTTPSGNSNFPGFVYLPAPVITSLSTLSAATGQPVIITGTNFSGVTTVTFGGVAAASFTVNSTTSISAFVGSGASGSVAVTSAGGSTSFAGFTYLSAPVISSVTPVTASAGSTITINGSYFTGVTSVTLGGVAAASFTVNSATSITVKVGTGASGNITLTNATGNQSFSGFTFVPVPVVIASGPVNIQTGGSVTLSTTPISGYTYQWRKDTVAIVGANAINYNATQSGSYTLKTTFNGVSTVSNPIVVAVTFALPASNFKLTNTGASCKGSTNGAINITAQQNLNYTATITNSSNVSTSYPFTTSLDINNLTAGTYAVCLTLASQPGYQQCFTAVITEPKDLWLYATVLPASNQVVLALAGANSYHITLNGSVLTTSSSQVTLDLKTGVNDIVVSTDINCQGRITRSITIADSKMVFPNPFVNSVSLDIGNDVVKKAEIDVYDTFSRKLYTQQFVNRSGIIKIDLPNMPVGIYMLKLKADNIETSYKIMKN